MTIEAGGVTRPSAHVVVRLFPAFFLRMFVFRFFFLCLLFFFISFGVNMELDAWLYIYIFFFPVEELTIVILKQIKAV